MQREMQMMGVVKKPSTVPLAMVRKCRHRLDAINLCMNLSGLTDATIASKLGISRGHLSKMRRGRASFPDTKTIHLMTLCGNLAPIQFEVDKVGYAMAERTQADRIAELEEENEQLKQRFA